MNSNPKEARPLRDPKNRVPPPHRVNEPPPLPPAQKAKVISLETPPPLPKPTKSEAQPKSNREMLFAGVAGVLALIALFSMSPSPKEHPIKPEPTQPTAPDKMSSDLAETQSNPGFGQEGEADFQAETEDGFSGFGDGSDIFKPEETFSDTTFNSSKGPIIDAGKGMLEITCPTVPDKVFIDGIDNGKPPMRRRLEPGQYLIKAQKSGYKPFYAWAGIELGEMTEIQLELIPK